MEWFKGEMDEKPQKGEGIVLGKHYLFAPAAIEAYYCENCKKIIIDVEKSKFKE